MNIFNIFKSKQISNFNIPNSIEIEEILTEFAHPKFEKFGLNNRYKYTWENNFDENGIKLMVRFSNRGQKGNFTIGTNFKFIPIVNTKNKIVYKRDFPHLFESIEFFGDENAITLWNKKFFSDSLKKFMNNDFPKVQKYLHSSILIENNIETAKRQLKCSKYEIHYPNPRYVLAFLYAKNGDIKNADLEMNKFLELNPNFNQDVIEIFEKIK